MGSILARTALGFVLLVGLTAVGATLKWRLQGTFNKASPEFKNLAARIFTVLVFLFLLTFVLVASYGLGTAVLWWFEK